MTTENFRDLSVCLTGVKTLPQAQCESFFERLRKAKGYCDSLVSVFSEYQKHGSDFNPKTHLEQADQLKCCRGIVFLWYTSELIAFTDLTSELAKIREGGAEEEYYASLVWKVIRAHPPGLTGGYYGHWKYEPEN